MLIIMATILTLTTPTGTLSPDACLIYLGIFRILLGIGISLGYPLSALITSDHSNIHIRGTMLSHISSNQGRGSFVGSLARLLFCCVTKVLWKGEGKHRKLMEVRKFFLIVLAIQPTFMDSMANYRWDFSRTRLRHSIPASHSSRVHPISLGSKIEAP